MDASEVGGVLTLLNDAQGLLGLIESAILDDPDEFDGAALWSLQDGAQRLGAQLERTRRAIVGARSSRAG